MPGGKVCYWACYLWGHLGYSLAGEPSRTCLWVGAFFLLLHGWSWFPGQFVCWLPAHLPSLHMGRASSIIQRNLGETGCGHWQLWLENISPETWHCKHIRFAYSQHHRGALGSESHLVIHWPLAPPGWLQHNPFPWEKCGPCGPRKGRHPSVQEEWAKLSSEFTTLFQITVDLSPHPFILLWSTS